METVRRPIGWWLKEADAALDAAFDAALGTCMTTRRGWQIMTTVAAGPASRQQLADALAGFDIATGIDTAVDELVRRGWIRDGEPLTLTDEGRAAEADLADRVAAVRRRVVDALPDGDYDRLVQLLARLVGKVR